MAKKHIVRHARTEALSGVLGSMLCWMASMKSIIYRHLFFLLEDGGVSFLAAFRSTSSQAQVIIDVTIVP